jgi:hypothetical protein
VAAINGDADPGAESEDMNDSADMLAKNADLALSTR